MLTDRGTAVLDGATAVGPAKAHLDRSSLIPRESSRPELALVHEWISARAGSEKVFEELAKTFPSADLYALSVEPSVQIETGGRPIRTTFLDHKRLRGGRSATLPLMAAAWRGLGQKKYPNVITSHHALAHVNSLRSTGAHLVYVHSPARYIWSPNIDSRGQGRLLTAPRKVLQRVDVAAAQRVTAFASNSQAVRDRVQSFWGRDSTVIYPPVDVGFYGQSTVEKEDYILGVGRWIGYKRFDFIIKLGEYLGIPVRIAGRGPMEGRLRELGAQARVPVSIYRSPTDEQLQSLYSGARALIFPTFEDFGIVPVEAQACGTPVVALGLGGARETVVDGLTGSLVDTLRLEDWGEALARCSGVKPTDCVENADRFSTARFVESMLNWTSAYGIIP